MKTLALVTTALLAFSACAADPAQDTSTDTVTSPAPATAASGTPSNPAKVTPPADPDAASDVPASLEFEGTTVDGKDFDARMLAGKPVVLWFWAPWCSVCRSQIPTVQGLASTYADEATVLGIGSLDDGDAIADFAADAQGPLHLTDSAGALWRKFEVTEQSSFVVLDADGEEVFRSGYADADGLEDAVKQAVAG